MEESREAVEMKVGEAKAGASLTTSPKLEIAAFQELAVRGQWRSLLEKLTSNPPPSPQQHPHLFLTHLSFHALSLFKLRLFSDASSLLSAHHQLFDRPLDPSPPPPHFLYQSHPHLSPLRGSMIPFSLRLLHSLLPTNPSQSLHRLYSLLHFTSLKLQQQFHDSPPLFNSNDDNNPRLFNSNDDGDDSNRNHNRNGSFDNNLWKRRESVVVSAIISQHLSAKQFQPCISLLHRLLETHPSDPYLLSKLAYLYLHIGHVDAARSAFSLVESSSAPPHSVRLHNLLSRNRALLYLVSKDYVSAVGEYDGCIDRDPDDLVAINNKALCLMYLRDLSDSIKVLEGALERSPTVALNEAVVVNLCSMYELAYVNHADIKKTLSNWIAKVAPDDFDSSCTRV